MKKKIATCDYFVGALFTGFVTVNSIKAALSRIPKKGAHTVEILVHACKAEPGEEKYWDRMPVLKDYYYSHFRDQEKEILTNPELKGLLDAYNI